MLDCCMSRQILVRFAEWSAPRAHHLKATPRGMLRNHSQAAESMVQVVSQFTWGDTSHSCGTCGDGYCIVCLDRPVSWHNVRFL